MQTTFDLNPKVGPELPTPAAELSKCVNRELAARQKVLQQVVGQTEAVELLLALAYSHRRAQVATRNHSRNAPGRYNLLLIGPPGSGKSFLPQVVCEALGIACAVVDATGFAPAGSKLGRSMDEIFGEMLQAAAGKVRTARRGALLIENLDQLAQPTSGSVTNDVQHSWMRLLNGRSRSVSAAQGMAMLHSQGWWVIASGVFNGLDRVVSRRTQNGGLGFQAGRPAEANQDHFGASDLVNFGLLSGLVARFPFVCELLPFSQADFVEISRLESSAVGQWVREFRDAGIQLEFSEEARQSLARQAIELKLGVGGLQAVLGGRLGRLMASLPCLRGKAQQVKVNVQAVEGEGQAEVILGPPLFPPRHEADEEPGAEEPGSLPPELEAVFPPETIPRRPARVTNSAQGMARLANLEDLRPYLLKSL